MRESERARLKQYSEHLEDIVDERTAELRAQYARLDAILRSTTDGIVVTDDAGAIIQTNPVAERWLTSALPPHDTERVRQTIRSLARETDESLSATLELSVTDLELTAAPVREGAQEKPTAVVISIHDVSHLKAMDRMKTNLLTNISHELRIPVTSIQAYAYLVQQTRPEDEKWSSHLRALLREANRQVRLVEEITLISQLYTEKLEIIPRPSGLSELLRTIVTRHQQMAEEQNVALEINLADDIGEAVVASIDPERITLVLNFLIEDGIRYTPTGGRVLVSCDRQEMEGRLWATLSVSDTGEGILPDDLPYIFDRFAREEEAQSKRVRETGLRLMIVKGIVDLHGGWVTVALGQEAGTIMKIWLPMPNTIPL